MQSRRSFLARLLAAPVAGVAATKLLPAATAPARSLGCTIHPVPTVDRFVGYFDPLTYAGEWKWETLTSPTAWPEHMGDVTRTVVHDRKLK